MEYYDSIAQGYDELHSEEQLKKLNIIKQEVIKLIINQKINAADNSNFLDVGCGSGISTEFFSCFDWIKNKTGIDPSEELIKIAKAKNQKTKYFVGRAESLPFKNEEFDFIVSLTAIQNFDDAEKGLKEIKRVGKNSTVFALSFLKRSPKKEVILQSIKQIFKIKEIIEEDKDIIVIC